MFVKDKMTRDPYTIQVSASINTLIGLMRDKKLRKVPVLDGEKLVGIVTDRDIERVSPSKATSLSVYEINYLLSKITVADAMVSEVITCSPDDYIEDAALVMRENRINSLLVMENGKLVGIVTDSDLFDALIDMMGGRTKGNKFILRVPNEPGVLTRISGIIAADGTNISRFTMTDAREIAMLYVITDPNSDVERTRAALEAEGFTIENLVVKK
ncbi:MAG: CBS domain-containing protein [Firmicutes bacterium]|nr:CBS domain-containing protein [Bacillota bacterium]